MSIYPKMTLQQMINLAKLSEPQKNQSIKIFQKSLKQTHEEKLAERFEPITKKIPKTTEAIEKFSCSKTKNQTPNQLAIENSKGDTYTASYRKH